MKPILCFIALMVIMATGAVLSLGDQYASGESAYGFGAVGDVFISLVVAVVGVLLAIPILLLVARIVAPHKQNARD